jgi:SAM-dependent methyltransferase
MHRVSRFPEPLKETLNRSTDWMFGVFSRGDARYCPICTQTAQRFRSAHGRPEARCMHCGALERHRFVWLYFQRRTDLFDRKPKTMLHIAPERCMERRLRDLLGEQYLTADVRSPRAMVQMDITQIQYPDATFDIIYCSHVLEHVPDDRQAIREIYRVLKPGGWAILLVPITAEHTIEDPTITDPVKRRELFGQADHVRRYGPDYVDRLRSAGFHVEMSSIADLCAHDTCRRMGLTPASGAMCYCAKSTV